MCGILAVVERSRPVDRARFARALASIGHRGPDCEGTAHFDLETRAGLRGVALGHRRLSIQDLSDRAGQPFRRSGAALTYNGEIYNFRALRAGMSGRFTTDSDTEVLFEILRRSGLEGLEAALGMWAFCHLDEAGGRLLASRDRLGKKPLFYFASDTTVCFASEIVAITRYLGAKPSMSVDKVDTYLAYGWALPGSGPSTPITGIRQVQPGGSVTVDLASWTVVTTGSNPRATWLAGAPVDEEELAAQARSAVVDRLVGDRKVGLLLSGGIDSSLILSVLASEGMHEQVRCFIGDAGKSDDAAFARRITDDLGIEAEVIDLDYAETSFDAFIDVCKHQEKPFPLIGNVLGLPQLYDRIAEHDVPVVLDGTGADEVFGGYWLRYYRFALAEAWDSGQSGWIEQSLAANSDQPIIDELGRETVAALKAGVWPPTGTVGAMPPTEIMSMLELYCQPDVAAAAPADPLARQRRNLHDALYSDVTDVLLPEWLWQNDRSAMRSGVENRSPFLDTRLSAQLGSGYRAKFDGPWNKHELRRLFDRFRPMPTQWRREKQGFRWVFARFLRANKSTVLDLIASSSLLRTRVDVARLIDAIGRDEELLFSDLTQRCLCLAGLETATGLRVQ